MPKDRAIKAHSLDANCCPQSEEGIPNRKTQVPMNALAMFVIIVEDSGTFSGQQVVLSTIVRSWVYLPEGKEGPPDTIKLPFRHCVGFQGLKNKYF